MPEQHAPENCPVCAHPPDLNDVLVTGELSHRPPRSPDYQAESQVLHALARHLVDQPQAMLGTLLDMALKLCRAGTAGISLLETTAGEDAVFRWVALAGAYRGYEGGTTPAHFSPCGTCLERKAPQLYAHPARYFTHLQRAEPEIVEALVIPLVAAGQPPGTIWIVAHDEARHFDAEDVRVMTSLADFTAAALRTCSARQAAEEAARRERTAHAEAARREREYKTLAENLPDVIARFDRGFRHLYVNPAVERMTGRLPAEFVGKTTRELGMPEDLCATVEVSFRRVFETGQEQAVEFSFAGPHGFRHYRTQLSPEPSRDGAVETIVGLTRDVTEQRLRLEELAEADRNKDAFLAQLGHELRNSLSPLLNELQVIRLGGDDRRVREGALDVAGRQVRQLKHLTDGLLDVARVRQGKMDLKKELIDLNAVLAVAVEMARAAIKERGHELEVSLPPGQVPVEADPARLQQVVVNLLNNACKYTAVGGRIRIAVERAAGQAVLRVEDTGIGLAPEMLERIFDLYAQAADGRRHSQAGLGIGLSLVKCLVEMHDGSVTAQSDGLGRGSAFVVRLPLREALPSREPPPPAAAPAGARSVRVLLVDDNLDSTRSLAQLLRLWGHEVETAADGPSALLLARAFRPEVVLLDVGLPGMDGREVGRRLRQEVGLEQAVLVAVTGFGQEEDSRLSRESGLDFHMVKPVDVDALQDLLARYGSGGRRDAPPSPARHESDG